MPLEIPDYNVWQLVFTSLYHIKGRPMRDLKIAQFRGDSFEDMLLKVGIDPKYIKRAYMLTSKTRHTRMSKITAYVHECCRSHASVEMHNIRYWRNNIRSYACASSDKNPLMKLINDNINQCYSRSVRAMACPSYILAYLSDIKIFRDNK